MDEDTRSTTVVRNIEHEVGGRRLRLVTTLDPHLPPAANISTAHCLAFAGDRIVLALHVDRDWTIPGGHLEPGESPETAMLREAKEEAGITVADPVVVANERIDPLGDGPHDPRYPVPSFQVFYVARLVSMGAISATDECTDARLFSPDEARSLPGWVVRHRPLYEAALDLADRLFGTDG